MIEFMRGVRTALRITSIPASARIWSNATLNEASRSWIRNLASTPASSRSITIEAQFTALRYFALDGTDHRTHQEQGSMTRRYIIWRNRHIENRQLRRIVARVNAA
jgi:hypothetical protein